MSSAFWKLIAAGAVVSLVANPRPIAAQSAEQQQRPKTLELFPVSDQPPQALQAPLSPPPRPGARVKRYDPDKKIVARFEPGDTDVVIEQWVRSPEASLPPSGYSAVAWRTIYSPVVALVTVSDVQGFITANGDWIDSRVTGVVDRVLKNATTMRLESGGPISFTSPGGLIRLGGKGVLQAHLRGSREVKKGRQYLIFTHQTGSDELRVSLHDMHEVSGKKLSPLIGHPGSLFEAVAATPVDEAVAQAIVGSGLQNPRRRQPR